jgi:hypothetical protein
MQSRRGIGTVAEGSFRCFSGCVDFALEGEDFPARVRIGLRLVK